MVAARSTGSFSNASNTIRRFIFDVPAERSVNAIGDSTTWSPAWTKRYASYGPLPMETTYTWEDSADGGTKMTLRNRGEPSGFASLAAPIMARAMRRANRKDLLRLKRLLETPPA
jgi:hypothetical protein